MIKQATTTTSTRGEQPRRHRSIWSRSVEAASLRVRETTLAHAARNFDHRLMPAQRMQLAREVATTRGAELTLAYKNVIMVATGHKRRQDRHGRERLSRTPCVVLVVRRKWERSQDAKGGAQLIPRRLLAYADIEGERVLCAVPTDVQPEQRYYGAAPQAARAVWVDDGVVAGEFGALTCAVEVASPGRSKRRLLLSARHVFSPVPEIAKTPISSNARVSPLRSAKSPPGAPAIGSTEPIGGTLRNQPEPSFDVQLASVKPAQWPTVRTLLQDMPLSHTEPFVATPERFDELVATHFFELLVPDNHPGTGMKPRPTFVARWETTLDASFNFEYPVRINGNRLFCKVAHWELLKLTVAKGRTPLGGDSGTPIVVWNDDGSCTLVAMHIAGIEDAAVSFAIPAWQLFEADNYVALPLGTRIVPINV